MKKCNRLQLITITNYDYPMSAQRVDLEQSIPHYQLTCSRHNNIAEKLLNWCKTTIIQLFQDKQSIQWPIG
jgi:hypothetical protein